MCEKILLLACDKTSSLRKEAKCGFVVGYQIFDGLVVTMLANPRFSTRKAILIFDLPNYRFIRYCLAKSSEQVARNSYYPL